MRICCKLGFQPLNSSNGVFATALVGTKFNIYIYIYIVFLRALVHKNLGSLELLNMLCIVSDKVLFLLSTTPF